MGKKNITQHTIVHFDLGGSKISGLAGYVDEDGALTIYGEEKQTSDEVKCGVVEKATSVAYKISELSKLLHNSLRVEQVKNVTISVNPKSMKLVLRSVNKRIERIITQDFLNQIKAEIRKENNSGKAYIYDIQELDYFIDGRQVENPIGRRGSNLRVDYRITIGQRQVQESIERSFDRTGIAVDYIHLGMDALSTVVLEDEDKQNGCALIEFGATGTTLAIYNENELQELLVVPLGGLNITKDIQELGISYEYAELLKCKKGCAMENLIEKPVNIKAPNINPDKAPVLISTSFLATIIEARLSEIMEPIFDAINQVTYRLQSGIVISGGAAKLLNIEDFITEKTGLQVKIGDHSEWLSEETPEVFFEPQYSQAIGAMILTNELNKEKAKNESTPSEPKIKRKLFDKISNKLNKGIGDLFTYDEIESNDIENK